jgi:hypothetical protein
MDEALFAAVQRFPDRQRALEALAARDESFRSLCSDFAEAQVALQRWRDSASPVRERRCSEYEELVESLAVEIASGLDGAAAMTEPGSEGKEKG